MDRPTNKGLGASSHNTQATHKPQVTRQAKRGAPRFTEAVTEVPGPWTSMTFQVTLLQPCGVFCSWSLTRLSDRTPHLDTNLARDPPGPGRAPGDVPGPKLRGGRVEPRVRGSRVPPRPAVGPRTRRVEMGTDEPLKPNRDREDPVEVRALVRKGVQHATGGPLEVTS